MWKSIVEVPRQAVLLVVKLYQKTLSPDHSFWRCFFPNGYCKFFPSCSQYTYCAIKKYGVIKGGLRAIKRIARCNPWNCGGVDVP